jgi:protocatechuate 3,4-dioxygenase, beta subunit
LANTIYQPYDDGNQTPHRVQGYARTFSRTPDAPFVERPLTLTERTGPLGVEQRLAVGSADFARTGPDGPRAQGPLMLLHGRVVDQDGNPVAGAMVEVWHANASGKYIHEDDGFNAPLDPNFTGGGRVVTDADGRFTITTVKPGPYRAGPASWRAPHIHFSIIGASWMDRMVTQMHFPGEPLNDFDTLLNAAPDGTPRDSMIARALPPSVEAGDASAFEHLFVLRGHAGDNSVA